MSSTPAWQPTTWAKNGTSSVADATAFAHRRDETRGRWLDVSAGQDLAGRAAVGLGAVFYGELLFEAAQT